MPYNGPDYYHQLGNNDQKRCERLLKYGYGSGVIFSPRDLKDKNMEDYAQKFRALSADLLIDPQLYNSEKPREQIPEIDSTQDFADPAVANTLLQRTMQVQKQHEVSRYIVPAPWARTLTRSWFEILRNFNETARRWKELVGEPRDIIATVAVSGDSIINEAERVDLLNQLSSLNVKGFYLITNVLARAVTEEHLYGLLDIIFRLKRQKHYILLGYTQPWVLITFPFGVDSFASSGIQNRSSFDPNNFKKGVPRPRGRTQYERLWSPRYLDYVRFPDDAAFLESSAVWNKLHRGSPFNSALEGRSPADVHAAKQWKQTQSHLTYSWMMWHLGNEFRSQGTYERIELVREKISSAQALHKEVVAEAPSIKNQGTHLQAWRNAFERYLAEHPREQLESVFG
jgi:hypothetical protein